MKPRWFGLIRLFVTAGMWLAAASSIGVAVAEPQAAAPVIRSRVSNSPEVSPPQAPVPPAAPQDIPDILVASGTVNDFARVDTTIYWHSVGYCNIIPTKPNIPANLGDVPESVSRISTIYASPPRLIYYKDIRATNSCNQYVFSRVVADDSNLYWVDATGLVKLSKNANPGDIPAVLSGSFANQQPYQIAIDSHYIYLSRDAYSVCGMFCITNPSILYKIDKSTGALTGLDCTRTVLGYTCPYASNMKVDPGERYLYYIDISGNLQRMDLSNPTSITQLATLVHSYYPEGATFTPCGMFICISDYVFIGRGDTAAGQTHEIIRYDNRFGSAVSIYTSSWTDQVAITDIVSDGSEIFFFEVRADLGCGNPCFQTYTAWLYRSGRANANSLANIYKYAAGLNALSASYNLDDDNVKVYWRDSGDVKRLSNQATALPQSPMHVVGMEVTQGVQTTGNTVPLIQGKRTFVRLYVKSDDSTRDVPKVSARLRATWTGGTGGGVGEWIDPTNVFAITVKRNPSRQNLDDAFLFELPWDWASGDNLQLTAELNPAHNPEQSDNYVNNMLTVGPFHLNPSPRLEIRLFGYSYAMSSTVYAPAYAERFGNIDWIRRAYPVNEAGGALFDAGAGLHWDYSQVRDDAVANLVRYPSVPCEDKDTTSSPDPKLPDCQNLRATAYVQSQISSMRDSFKAGGMGDTDNTTYYGLVRSGAEVRNGMVVSYFPRGQDGGKNGAGPAGNGYLGWYAGHEVGHSVGMGHPATASAGGDCGIKGGDSSPTYPHGHIGSNDDATNVEGFLDTPSYNYPRYNNSNLAPGSTTMDVMAYCLPQWLSDQNYVRIYKNLTSVTPTRPAAAPSLSGNWLIVYGGIFSGTNTATIDVLQHTIGDVTLLPRVPGNYAIRLRDVNGNVLTDYAFTPNASDDSNLLLYGQVVTFTAGTRNVRIVRLADQQVLADAAVSANPPMVSNVHLVGAPDPVTGTVTLAWNAGDADGDPLKFDIHYSHDGGASFSPIILHTAALSLPIDTSGLGGGTGVFRIVASDGANLGSADSPPFIMAGKPPTPNITLPSSNIHTHYGQVVNFSGLAWDAQDGVIAGSNLVWNSVTGTLHSGPMFSESLLPPGTNVITLTATNSSALSGSTSVTITVDDNIDPDGPTMQVAPGVVTWHINSGITASQTQTMAVTNFGTGNLTWQAGSDSSWLMLSATSGNQDESLIATGDPTGMHDGETRAGNVIFTSTSNGTTQTLTVPVSLIKGNIFQSPYLGLMPPLKFVYLPLIRK